MRWLFRAGVFYTLLCASFVLASVTLTRSCDSVDQSYDIAVVLGGGDEYRPDVRRRETGRVHAAIRLMDRDLVQRIHLTGTGELTGGSSSAKLLAQIAQRKGVPNTLLTLETQSYSTLQNAVFSMRYLPEEADLIVVTDNFHALRAMASFLWAGRSVDVCTSPDPDRSTREFYRVHVREIAAWAVNIGRASVWSAAKALGLHGRLPQGFLA